MRLDYWNHPLIVKAIRVKYRGGKLFMLATSYLMLLLVGGMVLFHYRAAMSLKDWAQVYFVIMVSVQFVISSIIAISSTSSSMQAEVSSRTMDFQRIATVSPLQILLGKAIGEPASSYMLAMATVPIAVFCSMLGEVSVLEVAMIYVTLATTTLMMASLGLQHSLDPTSKGAQAGGIAGGMFFFIFVASSIPFRFGTRGGFAELVSAAIGLFTPILSIKGIAFDKANMWTDRMPFFDFELPYAILTPIAQSAMAALALLFMVRRMTQPLLTSASKLQSYAVLAVADLIWAGLEFESYKLGEGLTAPAVRFAIGHTILSMLLVSRITPNRDGFQSWAWRLRGRKQFLWDHLAGERTLNFLSLFVFCVIGVTVFCGAILVPLMALRPNIVGLTNWSELIIASVLSILLVLCYGLFYQVLSVAMVKGAGVVLFVTSMMGMVGPFAVGVAYNLPLLSSLSPIATFIRLQDTVQPPYAPLPIFAVHSLAIVFWAWGLYGMASRTTRQVDRKLETMGVATRHMEGTQ